MSGIAGIIALDGDRADPRLAEKMLDSMRQRGPDSAGLWSGDVAALGQCMLRVTPESVSEKQPLVDEANGLVLVFDGRLDNRRELLRRLGSKKLGNDSPDPDIVLEAFLKWGEKAAANLLGDFAFAVWNAQTGELFCARDRVGACALAYVHTDSLFAFASEPEALLEIPEVVFEPDESCVATLFVSGESGMDDRQSWIKGVWALRAGESLSLGPGRRMQRDRYWSLEPGDYSRYHSMEECNEHFLEVFGEAVRCRLRSAHGVGLMMSGGLDSAAIVAMVNRLAGQGGCRGVNAYSVVGGPGEDDIESRCIRDLASGEAIDPHYFFVPAMNGMAGFDDVMAIAWDKPHPVDRSILLPELMHFCAARNGERAVLCGASGDLTQMEGPGYVAEWLRSGRWGLAWQECRAASRNHTELAGTQPGRTFLFSARRAFVPPRLQNFLSRVRTVSEADNPVSAELVERIRARKRQGLGGPGPGEPLRPGDRGQLARRIGLYVLSCVSGFGRVSTNHGVESRDPWADSRLLEFFVNLPLEYKVHGGWTKYQVRSSFSSELSPLVLQRRDKHHLGGLIGKKIMEESVERVNDAVISGADALRPYLDPARVEAIRQRYTATRDDESSSWMYRIAFLASWINRSSSI